MPTRALMIKGGTMKGAFLVGALKKIHEKFGPDYFDTIFATSVGVFEQAFFASGQIETMENTWREYVHGKQLINIINPLRGKPIMDLDYLVNLFKSEESLLDVDALKSSRPRLLTFITDYKTREPILVDLKDGPIFDIMRATSALPVLYPKKIIINDRRFVDSWFAPTKIFRKVIKEALSGYDEIIAISAYPDDKDLSWIENIIFPSEMHLRTSLDTNKDRIIKTIKQGEIDAEKFILGYKLMIQS